MAPAASAADIEQLAAYFEQCGLAPTAANETARGKQANSAKALFSANKLETKQVSTKQGLLALQIAKDGQKLTDESKTYVLDAVLDNRLKAPDQVTGELPDTRKTAHTHVQSHSRHQIPTCETCTRR